jgi:hypothetical protein
MNPIFISEPTATDLNTKDLMILSELVSNELRQIDSLRSTSVYQQNRFMDLKSIHLKLELQINQYKTAQLTSAGN